MSRGEIASILKIKYGRVINVFSREVIEADVAIHDGIIAGTDEYKGNELIDVKG